MIEEEKEDIDEVQNEKKYKDEINNYIIGRARVLDS